MIHKVVMLMVIHNADGEKENKHETVRCRPREESENCDDDDMREVVMPVIARPCG